jgi:isoamylase
MRHPDVPEPLRGTYAGLASAPVIEHLQRLGVTTVELMPVHAFVDDRHLVERGLRNYWGYNTIGFFAPDPRYSATGKLGEFKTMVRTLHAAGLEVILDVVYNHTAEGNEFGPDAVASRHRQRRLLPAGAGHAALLHGLHRLRQHAQHAAPARAAAADGLAALLGHRDARRRLPLRPRRGAGARAARGGRLTAFFDCLRQDPVLSRVKLIAEPWDVGPGGYQVGNFPPGWAEWNDKYRDTMRAYWKGDGGLIGEFAPA